MSQNSVIIAWYCTCYHDYPEPEGPVCFPSDQKLEIGMLFLLPSSKYTEVWQVSWMQGYDFGCELPKEKVDPRDPRVIRPVGAPPLVETKMVEVSEKVLAHLVEEARLLQEIGVMLESRGLVHCCNAKALGDLLRWFSERHTFEVTIEGYDASSSATDHLVLWINALDEAHVQAFIETWYFKNKHGLTQEIKKLESHMDHLSYSDGVDYILPPLLDLPGSDEEMPGEHEVVLEAIREESLHDS